MKLSAQPGISRTWRLLAKTSRGLHPQTAFQARSGTTPKPGSRIPVSSTGVAVPPAMCAMQHRVERTVAWFLLGRAMVTRGDLIRARILQTSTCTTSFTQNAEISGNQAAPVEPKPHRSSLCSRLEFLSGPHKRETRYFTNKTHPKV